MGTPSFLPPPNRAGLRDAHIQPAEIAGYQFEASEMIESMFDHLEHTPGTLSLLQLAASQLWEMRDRERRLLTSESYHRISGIAGALSSHADAVVAECTQREQAIVRALFLRLVTPERTRAIVPMSELYELSNDAVEVRRIVERLVQSHLLVGQNIASARGTSASGTVKIVHESLISDWALLRRWLDETQEDAAFLEQLRNVSKQWRLKGYAPDLLWRGAAMQEAKLWHRRYRGKLPDLQRAYLSAVFALSARATRHKRLAVSAVMGSLSVIVVITGIGLYTVRKAQQEASVQAHRVEKQPSLSTKVERSTRAAEIANNTELEKTRAELEKAIAANNDLATKNAELVAAIEAAARAQQATARAQQAAARARGGRGRPAARRAVQAPRAPGDLGSDRRRDRSRRGQARERDAHSAALTGDEAGL